MLTAQQLRAATGCTAARADEWLPHIARACETFAINTPARLAAFLAQIGHESGRLARCGAVHHRVHAGGRARAPPQQAASVGASSAKM